MATRRIVMHFPQTMIDEPIISRLVRVYDLEFNILRASITPKQEGLMILVLEGDESKLAAALDEVQQKGVRIEPLEKEVTRNDDRCTECGACITICPTHALAMEPDTRHVVFDPDKCIACELCVPVCPPRAMETPF
ncbi:MAG TPA: (Fe-S)-binding protein [Armatimonadetes bacterium]|nr:(Fe-S)-binding protein [Armatimonadota bacterium]